LEAAGGCRVRVDVDSSNGAGGMRCAERGGENGIWITAEAIRRSKVGTFGDCDSTALRKRGGDFLGVKTRQFAKVKFGLQKSLKTEKERKKAIAFPQRKFAVKA